MKWNFCINAGAYANNNEDTTAARGASSPPVSRRLTYHGAANAFCQEEVQGVKKSTGGETVRLPTRAVNSKMFI